VRGPARAGVAPFSTSAKGTANSYRRRCQDNAVAFARETIYITPSRCPPDANVVMYDRVRIRIRRQPLV
jgi:hypothetical protein